MSAIRSKDTTPEIAVRRLVHSLGFRYRLHVRDLPGTPDLVFARHRKIIDVSGCFWHSHHCARSHIPHSRLEYWEPKLQRNKQRDRRNRQALRRRGWQILIVWECEVKDLRALTKRIRRFLGNRRNETTVARRAGPLADRGGSATRLEKPPRVRKMALDVAGTKSKASLRSGGAAKGRLG
jgi:DNA mismatch endonuclease (patch repair protein)